MKNKIFLVFVLFSIIGIAQPNWTLKFSSTVEKDGKGLGGAQIAVQKAGATVASATSGGNGDFTIDIPPDGDFILVVSYAGCNSKRFRIDTRNVPADMNQDNFKASIKIEGVTMSKAVPGVNYSALNQPLALINYVAGKKKFSDDEAFTSQNLAALMALRQQEQIVIDKYNAAIKSGDVSFIFSL